MVLLAAGCSSPEALIPASAPPVATVPTQSAAATAAPNADGPVATPSQPPSSSRADRQSAGNDPARADGGDQSQLRTVVPVDGDTVKLPDGRSIRVIGVDTPERGECGYNEASSFTGAMVSGGVRLSLPAGHENTDHYDRLLRSITTKDGKDLGLELIKAGWANARYDGIDGYDPHPQQDVYRAASQRTAHQCPQLDDSVGGAGAATSAPTSAPKSTTSGQSGCDPNYSGTCVPDVPHDLDCADIDGPVTVEGNDRHNFDGNNDGVGCE
jgi:endonuclease YncB( thermonuclease family)